MYDILCVACSLSWRIALLEVKMLCSSSAEVSIEVLCLMYARQICRRQMA